MLRSQRLRRICGQFAHTTVPGLYAAGDMANVPHNYMLGAFTNGAIAGEDAIVAGETDFAEIDKDFIEAEKERVLARRATMTAFPQPDRIQDPAASERLSAAAESHSQDAVRRIGSPKCATIQGHGGHEQPRATTGFGGAVNSDCADGGFRVALSDESRWGLYHHRADYPEKDDENWFCRSFSG